MNTAGLRKILGFAVVDPLAHQHRITRLDPVSPKFQLGRGLSTNHVYRREQPQGLGDHDSRVRQPRKVSAFALMEAAIMLAAVGRRYRFTLDADAVIGIKSQITLLPANGIPTTFERR